MKQVEPQVFLLGKTTMHKPGVQAYLDHLGVPDWSTDAPSDAEALVELYGRGCYMSYASEETALKELNPNISRTRVGNDVYINNLVRVQHGSVVEHAMVNFMFCDVSRVFTHELVRHRIGTAMSQQSLRYVRLESLAAWMPPCIKENEEALTICLNTMEQLEQAQVQLAQIFELDEVDADGKNKTFAIKKQVTSAMRRIAPIGLATQIGWSANFRALRHTIEMRTHPSAEVEIRKVFAEVGRICVEEFPNMFADYIIEDVKGLPWFTTEHRKI